MAWWWNKAGKVSQDVKNQENEYPSFYEDETVNQAIVHTRQDTVVVASLLDSLNGQVRTIKWFVGIGVTVYILNLPFWQNI